MRLGVTWELRVQVLELGSLGLNPSPIVAY